MEPIIKKRVERFKDPRRRVGATYVRGEGVHVRVWAPEKMQIEIQWIEGITQIMEKDEEGYFYGLYPDAKPGDRYAFVVDGKTLPDPATRYQPHGIRGPSEVVDTSYRWTDHNWQGVPFKEWVIYELHVGTFSERGDFQGVIDDLPRLRDLGVNVIEIMPVSQFPGERNWGYDGVFPHSVQNSYGGPQGLKALVDACHNNGIAIILDVVYNHLGPEGDVLPEYGMYYQTKYKTPWGSALNFDGPMSENVRNYFLQTVWQWLVEYRFDGLRLDAVHTILDTSPIPFLEELTRLKTHAEKERGLRLITIAETDRNDSRMLAPADLNGIGLDAQWADDLHHCLHVAITGETGSYYVDFGGMEQLARTYRDGVSFQGEYSFSRGRCHGRSYSGIDKNRLVVQTQNHDQIGNRIHGKRLNSLIDFERLKLDAAAIFLSPCTPLFFMGEEVNLDTPFHYFVSHENEELLKSIREGRNEEFNLTMEEIDPASPELYGQSVLRDKSPAQSEKSQAMYDLFKDLVYYSKEIRRCGSDVEKDEEQKQIILIYHNGEQKKEMRVILSFYDEQTSYIPPEGSEWTFLLKTADYQDGKKNAVHEAARGTILIPSYSAVIISREAG